MLYYGEQPTYHNCKKLKSSVTGSRNTFLRQVILGTGTLILGCIVINITQRIIIHHSVPPMAFPTSTHIISFFARCDRDSENRNNS